jgi:MoaA/NifB/PqqE/SkfB family radical SAM enzyme
MNGSGPNIAERFTDSLTELTVDVSVRIARRMPAFRDHVLNRLSRTLGDTYRDCQMEEELRALQIWFGRALRPFIVRLLEERPRAARKLVQLAYVWSRDLKRRVKIESETGKVTVATVAIEPTGRCNLNCPGCYADSTAKGADLPYELWRRVVEDAREMGMTLITLTGGEPFMREAKDRFISRMAAEFPNLGFLVYTNSTMITEEVARRLGEVGNVFPAISVEGYDEETDARRGESYSSRARRARETLAENEVLHGFSATVTRKNAHIFCTDDFIERRIREGDLFGWFFLLQPIGRKPDPSLFVTPEQRLALRERIYKWRKEERPLFIGDFWNDGLITGGCIAAGRGYFHIYADGSISPCVFAPIACENVRNIYDGTSPYKSLSDVVNGHPLFKKFREKQGQIHDQRAPCMLFDHPELIRQVCKEAPWVPGKNMPEGYLDGAIAEALDASSGRWNATLQQTAMVPECVKEEVEAVKAENEVLRAADVG